MNKITGHKGFCKEVKSQHLLYISEALKGSALPYFDMSCVYEKFSVGKFISHDQLFFGGKIHVHTHVFVCLSI